jgi:ATP-dependent Lon protease
MVLHPVKDTLPLLPIRDHVLFPNLLIPLTVSRTVSVAAVEAALAREDKVIAIFTQKDPKIEEPKSGDLYKIGTLAVIKKMIRIEQVLNVIVQGIQRAELLGATTEKPFLNVTINPLPEPQDWNTEIEASHRAMIDLSEKMLELVDPEMKINLNYALSELKKPLNQAYLIASLLPLDVEKEIVLLSASTQREVFQLMYDYLSHEIKVLELRNRITSTVQTELGREQREYLLRQQLDAIKKELGEESPEQAAVSELRKRAEESELPETVLKELNKELVRLERMSSISPDYQLTRNYVELVLELPWKKETEDNLDLERARRVLDEDHFNLREVKERIIEHLAVMKLNPQAKSPIVCFVGPPGVGKTSVGQSIGRALGRKFERMSLGGLHDEAELRGHRRTYIGAMPGRIIQAIRRAGVKNPLLMLDEVDKLGRDFRGDPAAALMEILDPAQNFDFHDNYLDLPFDLSKVFFITTANTLDSIPKPLLDRMEVMRLAGYTDQEKIEIAKRYLIPRQLGHAGLTSENLSISDEALLYVIRRYTREAGVRELERTLGSIARKVATRFAQGKTEQVTVTPENLHELLGPEHFYEDEARRELTPGVAAGLAWTEAGGEILYVEAVLLEEGKDLTLTGQLGKVMQESAKTAQSYVWSRSEDLGIDKDSVRKSGVHIHVPAGAIPKDGPSAGVAMATALASLYTGFPARSDTAMTGEITLSGLVLPVGGIKEKVLAAHRSGIKIVILPKDNEKDLEELPDNLRKDIKFVGIKNIDELLVTAIPQIEKRLRRKA